MIVQPSNMKRLAAELPKSAPLDARQPLDKPSQVARDAAPFAQGMQFNLLVMSSRHAAPQARLEAAERVFQVWSPLCALMSELEACCPNASEAGYAQAEVLRSIARRREEAA